MSVVYIDELFLINLITDYILLLLTGKICGIVPCRGRLAAAAAFGGVYAAAGVFRAFAVAAHPLIKLASGVAMVMIAYGNERRLLRVILVFMSVAAVFGGSVLALASAAHSAPYGTAFAAPNLRVLLISFAVTFGIMTLLFSRRFRDRSGGGISDVEIEHMGRTVKLQALRDTGNSLSDPITGRKVLVADIHTLGGILDEEYREIMEKNVAADPVKIHEIMQAHGMRGLVLIPYRAVGISSGLLPAFRPDRITVDGKDTKTLLVAISPNEVSDCGAYSALLGI